MAVSVLPLLPDGEMGVDRVLHAAECALGTAETAVSTSSAAAVRLERRPEGRCGWRVEAMVVAIAQDVVCG